MAVSLPRVGRFSWGVLVLVLGLIAGATTGCTLTVAGLGAKPSAEPPLWAPVVDADAVMLTLAQMRGITGGGEDLSVIPSMDSDYPVDIDLLARDAPRPAASCSSKPRCSGSTAVAARVSSMTSTR